jgi:tetratricopeptide (TPR) repeat protein
MQDWFAARRILRLHQINAMSDGSPQPGRSQPSQSRQIRVFISSTFRDMQAERDYLVKFIFPQLRKLCESRGVTWGEVDLRWGVTDEQAAEGKVLPICLEEIRRCRPYFIGLLGERYGWIPDALPADLIEREDWLKEHLHGKTSVTELEILHGVLNNPAMTGQAFFYFRDPKYLETLGDTEKKLFTAENTKDAEKLRTLKNKIRRGGLPVRENYSDPKALGELILADFTKVINDNWPEGSQPDPLDREAMDHEAYAQSRERVYIGRQEYFGSVDTHAAANDTQPLVILGESGSGKSALLANWVARYRQAHPDALVLQHYIGATPYSADWAAMLRRLMGEFKRRFGLQQDIPDQPDALRSAFPNWLYMAAASLTRPGGHPLPPDGRGAGDEGFRKIVIVLDALNQLEDRDGAPDLVWLPPVLPENVRLIVSTLPGRPLDEIQKRNWPTLKVELLSADERRKLIAKYLAQHAKSLNPARVERIAAAPPSANPLYLRVLLDELRLVRTHEELEERIGDYLKAESPYALYEKVIARWEQDYEGDSDLVGDTLSLLWAVRRGLTETELLQALGKNGEPLPRAKWSPLFLAMSDALISRDGLLTFAHDFLRTAARDAYLPNEMHQQQVHTRLADYFERQPAGPRRTDELPWQLAEARAWQRLQDLLADRVFFKDAFTNRNQFEVKTYWARIEAGSTLRLVKAYSPQIQRPEAEADKYYLERLSLLLGDTGHPEEALRLRSTLIGDFRDTGDWKNLQTVLGNQAVILRARGDLDGAMTLHREEERICRQLGNLDGLQCSLGNQACILRVRGDPGRAMALHKEAEQICRELGNLNGLQCTLSEQALILKDRGDLNGAMALHKEAERICRQLGNLDDLQRTLDNEGLILQSKGDLDQAMALHKEAERICRQLGNLHSLSYTLFHQARVLHIRGELDNTMALYKESEQICRQLGDLNGLQATIGSQAAALWTRGNLDEALALHKEAERICRQLGNLDDLQRTLGNQALIERARGDLRKAMLLHKEQERICRQLGNMESLAISLVNQSLVLHEAGRAREALPLAESAHRLAASHGYGLLVKQIEPIFHAVREAAVQE